MTEAQVRIDSVRVEGRYRRDLGDIKALARSIEEINLINPITITPDSRLVAGQRRLEACRALGWKTIPARIVDNLEDAVSRLKAERDENTERKAMAPEELVRLGKALEEMERPKARDRKAHGATAPGRRIDNGEHNASVHVNGSVGETREVVAEALGWSASTYDRAKTVVDAAADPTASSEEREVAQAALADMNTTGNVGGNYDKVRKARDARLGAPQKTLMQTAKRQRKAIEAAVIKLSGISHGLKQIEAIHPDITSEEAARWMGDLSDARLVIEQLIKRLRLKERTSA